MRKNWKTEFKKYSQSGDYQTIAEAVGIAEKTVAAVFSEKRTDKVLSTESEEKVKQVALQIVDERIKEAKEFLKENKFRRASLAA